MTSVLRFTIALLCCVGLYASLHMWAKSQKAERGELDEPSIVEEAQARLFFGKPNSLFGCFYFPLLLLGVLMYALFASRGSPAALFVRWLVLAALAAATGTSIFLAYSLAVINKRQCTFCWASHIVNTLLFLTVPWTMF